MPAGPNPLRTRTRSPSQGFRRETAARPLDAEHPRVESVLAGPRVADRAPSPGPNRRRKVLSVGAARLPQIGGLSVWVLSVSNPLIVSPLVESKQPKIQLLTVDHSARGSMKTAANCVS